MYFFFLTALFFFLTFFYSNLTHPIPYFAAYAWNAPFALSLVYIVIISTDVFGGFLYLTTEAKNAKKYSSLLNFLLISLFYLGNLVLTFLKNRGSLDWNILYLEAPFILVISSFLGIWAHKKKEPIYQSMADFSPTTAIWLVVLAINCFVCFGHANVSGNDPLQEVLEDAVIFSQLSFGLMFIVFVIANFLTIMEQNLPAHAVVYKPKFMPFGFVRIIGVIGVFALVMYHNQYQVRQAKAGYYVGIGETYIQDKEELLGEEYMKTALYYDAGNHKANYILGILAHEKSPDDPISMGLIKQAMFKNYTPQSYATLGHFLLQDGDIIRSLETLKEGMAKFPHSPEILNNLALAFSKTDIHDSTLYYFEKAKKYSGDNFVPAANLLAFALNTNTSPSSELDAIPDDIAYQTNLLALHNKTGKILTSFPYPTFLKDSVLTAEKMAFVNNLAYHNLKDTVSFKLNWLDSLIKKPANQLFVDQLMQAKAFRQYYGGKIAEGIASLDQLQTMGINTVANNHTLSNWFMQQDAPRMALDFLEKARNAGDLKTAFGTAIATSFIMPSNKALDYWKDPVLLSDTTFKKISFALSAKEPNVYSIGIMPQLFVHPELLYKQFYALPKNNEKQKALGRLMQYLNETGHHDLAIRLYQENDKTQESEWQYLRALRYTNQKELALKAISNCKNAPCKYIQAWATKNPNQAQKLYKEAINEHPIYEEGLFDAISFLEPRQKNAETYAIALQSVLLNPYSIAIQKVYLQQCIRMNLFSFIDYTLAKLKDLMPPTEYQKMEAKTKKEIQDHLEKMEWK